MMRALPTSAWLDQIEMQWPVDPIADALVAEIFADHALAVVNRVLQHLLANRDVAQLDHTHGVPQTVLAAMRDYFARVPSLELPAWADPEKVRRSQHLFLQHGLTSYLVLAGASLPECYLAGDIARVLGATHKLEDDVHRRVMETSQFVIDVIGTGDLTAREGSGWMAVHRVRLLHATVRHLILRRQAGLSGAGDSVGRRLVDGEHAAHPPNNQVLMALTLQTFAYVILRGLARLGLALSAQQNDDYIHTWSVIGHFLGIRDELLPGTYAQARDLFELLKHRQRAATTDGRLLTRHLLVFSRSMLPWYLGWAPRMLLCDLMSEADCDALGVRRLGALARTAQHAALRVLRAADRIEGAFAADLPAVLHLWEGVARRLLTRLSQLPPNEQRRIFSLPGHLPGTSARERAARVNQRA
jgi:hypothetical protein